jgi:hypothetical protein
MRNFMPLAGLCLLTLLLGCGTKNTENNQAESNDTPKPNTKASSLSSPFEALPSHPRFELSNLRFPSPDTFTVTWRLVSGTTGNVWGDWALAINQPGSYPTSLGVHFWDDKTTGEISGELRSFGGGNTEANLESGCEVFMTVREGEHTFKVSNALTSGSVSNTPSLPASQEVAAQIEQYRQQRKTEREQQQAAAKAAAQTSPTAQDPKPAAPQPAVPKVITRPTGFVLIPATVPLPNATELMALRSDNQWIAATIVGERADGFLQVQWKDNSGSPDEFLPRTKLAIKPAELSKLVRLRSRRPGK